MFTLVRDRDRHQDLLFPIVPVLFPVPVQSRFRAILICHNSSITLHGTGNGTGIRNDGFLYYCTHYTGTHYTVTYCASPVPVQVFLQCFTLSEHWQPRTLLNNINRTGVLCHGSVVCLICVIYTNCKLIGILMGFWLVVKMTLFSCQKDKAPSTCPLTQRKTVNGNLLQQWQK